MIAATTVTLFLAIFVLSSGAPTDDAKVLGFNNGTRLEASESDIKIYYHSKKMDGVEIPHSNFKGAVDHTDFNPNKRTIFTVHGWRNNNHSPFCKEIRDAYLRIADCNIFVVDWHSIAKLGYLYARGAVPEVAKILGKLIDSLMKNNRLNLNDVIIVGHSLGAHVAGLTGAALHGQVNTIIGLDPAGPNFAENKLNERLDASDARFVQAVHTCPGLLGATYRVGHADYYANNGRSQPGCGIDVTGTCAHSRAYLYFAESLKSGKFISHQCDSFAKLRNGSCDKSRQSRMGEYNVDKSASGTYYFETNASPPYAKW